MKKIHILYPEDNKMMINSVKLIIDNQEYILDKRKAKIIEVDGDVHQIKVVGESFSNIDISLSGGKAQISGDVSKKIWCDTSISMVEEDEYYLFKTPLFLSGKGKLKKVSKDIFNKKSQ